MFFLDKEIEKLDVPVEEIVCLFSSMNEVQVALPGFPGQRSSAYLCVHTVSGGYRAVAALVLHEVRQLAFYRCKSVFSAEQMEDVVEEGLLFVESMGFMLNDLDFKNRPPEEKMRLWDSFPLCHGSAAIVPAVDLFAAAPSSQSSLNAEDMPPSTVPAGEGDVRKGMAGDDRRLKMSRRIGRLLASF